MDNFSKSLMRIEEARNLEKPPIQKLKISRPIKFTNKTVKVVVVTITATCE